MNDIKIVNNENYLLSLKRCLKIICSVQIQSATQKYKQQIPSYFNAIYVYFLFVVSFV